MLYYGIGTMFSMAVLSAMVSIALEMVARVSASFWASALAGSLMGMNFTEGITSQSMQQGGMGLILTVLIVSTPPMAAMFFQGTMGNFMAYSQVTGTHGAAQPTQAHLPVAPVTPAQASSSAPRQNMDMGGVNPFTGSTPAVQATAGQRGNASRTE